MKLVKTFPSCVLKFSVPLDVRESEAGAHQFRQQSVEHLPLSATLSYYERERERNPAMGDRHNMAIALQKTGRPRPDSLVCPSASSAAMSLH